MEKAPIASTALDEIWAPGADAPWIRPNHFLQSRAREARLFLGKRCLYFLARKRERNKRCLAGAMIVRREPCQSVATVYELFDR